MPATSGNGGNLIIHHDMNRAFQNSTDFVESAVEMGNGTNCPGLQNQFRAAEKSIGVFARHLKSNLSKFAVTPGTRGNVD